MPVSARLIAAAMATFVALVLGATPASAAPGDCIR